MDGFCIVIEQSIQGDLYLLFAQDIVWGPKVSSLMCMYSIKSSNLILSLFLPMHTSILIHLAFVWLQHLVLQTKDGSYANKFHIGLGWSRTAITNEVMAVGVQGSCTYGIAGTPYFTVSGCWQQTWLRGMIYVTVGLCLHGLEWFMGNIKRGCLLGV